ncbi:putative nuclease HARBI1 [Sardina pilchardus]|uniref:putative nuclease HARBI1 n=1 Tax=Sardina pilchardus TaxID=27697 RepID=UPI002E0F2E10
MWESLLQLHKSALCRRERRWRARLRQIAMLLPKVQHRRPRRYAQVVNNTPLLVAYFRGEDDLRTIYRLSRQSLDALIRLLPHTEMRGWGPHITVLITVYWLGHGVTYSVVAQAFQVPAATVCRLVHSGCQAIKALRSQVIQLPTGQGLDVTGQAFAAAANSPAFARCVGAIDGCHVRIKTPPGPEGQDYLNRKLFPSMQMQAVCDGRGKFLNIFVGYPGSVHDTRVLRNSRIYREALYPPPGYYIVGDGGYPCISHPIAIITPYREPVEGRMQSRFNQRHAKALNVIERAFDMLKARWRCLLSKALEVEHTFVPTVITACAVLQNICLMAGDIEDCTEADGDIGVPPPGPVRGARSGHGLRDRLAAQVSELQENMNDHDYCAG